MIQQGFFRAKVKSENIINGLKGRIVVFEDRLTLASEKVEAANQAKAEVERQFQVYKSDVEANKEHRELAATAAKVDAAIEKLSAANNEVRSAVGIPSVSLSDTPLPLRDQEDKGD